MPSDKAVKRHIFMTLACHNGWKKAIESTARSSSTPANTLVPEDNAGATEPVAEGDTDLQMGDIHFNPGNHFEAESSLEPVQDQRARVDDATNNIDNLQPPPGTQSRFIEYYPHHVAEHLRREQTAFESLKTRLEADKKQPWEPFESEEEWELASWLLKNVSQKSTNDYLKLPIVSWELYVPFDVCVIDLPT